MLRDGLAVAAGALAWVAVVTALRALVRSTWPAYVAVEGEFAFTLAMKLARLAVGAVATLTAGWTAGRLSRRPLATSAVLGGLVFLAAIPDHVLVWDKYPLWYHLVFFASILPLALAGGRIAMRRTREPAPDGRTR